MQTIKEDDKKNSNVRIVIQLTVRGAVRTVWERKERQESQNCQTVWRTNGLVAFWRWRVFLEDALLFFSPKSILSLKSNLSCSTKTKAWKTENSNFRSCKSCALSLSKFKHWAVLFAWTKQRPSLNDEKSFENLFKIISIHQMAFQTESLLLFNFTTWNLL